MINDRINTDFEKNLDLEDLFSDVLSRDIDSVELQSNNLLRSSQRMKNNIESLKESNL